MPHVFDRATGAVDVIPNVTLRSGTTASDVQLKGVTFVREIDTKTGWVFRTAGPYDVVGRSIYLSLGFENDRLRTVGFSFDTGPRQDNKEMREEHDRFLWEELGQPSETNERRTIYRYSWGEITSEIDPHGGLSQILVRWM